MLARKTPIFWDQGTLSFVFKRMRCAIFLSLKHGKKRLKCVCGVFLYAPLTCLKKTWNNYDFWHRDHILCYFFFTTTPFSVHWNDKVFETRLKIFHKMSFMRCFALFFGEEKTFGPFFDDILNVSLRFSWRFCENNVHLLSLNKGNHELSIGVFAFGRKASSET